MSGAETRCGSSLQGVSGISLAAQSTCPPLACTLLNNKFHRQRTIHSGTLQKPLAHSLGCPFSTGAPPFDLITGLMTGTEMTMCGGCRVCLGTGPGLPADGWVASADGAWEHCANTCALTRDQRWTTGPATIWKLQSIMNGLLQHSHAWPAPMHDLVGGFLSDHISSTALTQVPRLRVLVPSIFPMPRLESRQRAPDGVLGCPGVASAEARPSSRLQLAPSI